jgi:hypothetical protein
MINITPIIAKLPIKIGTISLLSITANIGAMILVNFEAASANE